MNKKINIILNTVRDKNSTTVNVIKKAFKLGEAPKPRVEEQNVEMTSLFSRIVRDNVVEIVEMLDRKDWHKLLVVDKMMRQIVLDLCKKSNLPVHLGVIDSMNVYAKMVNGLFDKGKVRANIRKTEVVIRCGEVLLTQLSQDCLNEIGMDAKKLLSLKDFSWDNVLGQLADQGHEIVYDFKEIPKKNRINVPNFVKRVRVNSVEGILDCSKASRLNELFLESLQWGGCLISGPNLETLHVKRVGGHLMISASKEIRKLTLEEILHAKETIIVNPSVEKLNIKSVGWPVDLVNANQIKELKLDSINRFGSIKLGKAMKRVECGYVCSKTPIDMTKAAGLKELKLDRISLTSTIELCPSIEKIEVREIEGTLDISKATLSEETKESLRKAVSGDGKLIE